MSDSTTGRNKSTALRQCSIGALILVALLSAGSASAQGDGPRTHWKEMLTGTNVFNFTYMHASGSSNPLDPSHTILPGADISPTRLLYLRSRGGSRPGHAHPRSEALPHVLPGARDHRSVRLNSDGTGWYRQVGTGRTGKPYKREV